MKWTIMAAMLVLATFARAAELTEMVRDHQREAERVAKKSLATNTVHSTNKVLIEAVEKAKNLDEVKAALVKVLASAEAELQAKKDAEKAAKDKAMAVNGNVKPQEEKPK